MSTPNTRLRRHRSLNSYAVESTTPLPIILEVQGDTLAFRHKGSRQRFTITIDRAMQEAMIETAARTTKKKDDLFA